MSEAGGVSVALQDPRHRTTFTLQQKVSRLKNCPHMGQICCFENSKYLFDFFVFPILVKGNITDSTKLADRNLTVYDN